MTRRDGGAIGLDVHREFAQVAIWQGGLVTPGRQVRHHAGGGAGLRRQPGADAMRWRWRRPGNTWAIATLLASRAGRVVVSNPAKTRAIAEAKVKTDKVDAADPGRSCWRRTTCRRCGAPDAGHRARCAVRCCAARTSCASGPG